MKHDPHRPLQDLRGPASGWFRDGFMGGRAEEGSPKLVAGSGLTELWFGLDLLQPALCNATESDVAVLGGCGCPFPPMGKSNRVLSVFVFCLSPSLAAASSHALRVASGYPIGPLGFRLAARQTPRSSAEAIAPLDAPEPHASHACAPHVLLALHSRAHEDACRHSRAPRPTAPRRTQAAGHER